MSEVRFKSSLTLKEIDDNFKDTDFFTGIMEGLEEAFAYEKGKASAETFARKQALPSVNVTEIRKSPFRIPLRSAGEPFRTSVISTIVRFPFF